MTRQQEQFIRDWYEWNTKASRNTWDRMPRFPNGVFGMAPFGNRITDANGTESLAVMLSHETGLVRMTLPNPMTYSRHRMIVRIVESLGGKTFTVPRTVLRAASVIDSTIEVIDTHNTKVPLRAKESLIRAQIRTGGEWNSFLGRRVGPFTRETYFLGGFDRNERRLSYFFCELAPGVHPTTVAEAYETLKPPSVLVAEAQRVRRIKRQGDMFLIPTKRPIDKISRVDHNAYVHGSNHMASERLITQNGLVYVRGNLVHRPSGRRPDHKPLHLGGHWHLCVKNTVPVVG